MNNKYIIVEENLLIKNISSFTKYSNNYKKNNICFYNINKKLNKKNIKNNRNNIIIVFLYIISYYLYFLSLEKCLDGVDECGIKIKWIIIKLIELLFSCLIISLLFLLIISNIISKIHILHFIIIFIIFYSYSHGYDFNDHGYFNLIGFFSLLISILIIIFIFKCIFFFLKKNFYCFIITFILIIVFLIYKFLANNPINCDDWSKGLNNTFIENDINKYGCQIKIPNECPYKILKYFQDFTKIKGIKCKNRKIDAKQIYLYKSTSPFITKKTERIGFPITNKDPICLLDSKDDFLMEKFFFKNLIDYDNKTQLINKTNENKKPEIILDFSKNPYGEIIINLNYNETLSINRKKLENNSIPYSNNIIIIYIDSVSRSNSIRQLKKTLNFFEKFISYKGGFNQKYPKEIYHSFQFFKYHSFKDHTRGNYPRLIYGNYRNFNNSFRITKYLKENGYITSYANDVCQRDNSRIFHNLTFNEIDDHQFLLCDPTRQNFNKNTIKCLYGKTNTDYLFEYSRQFWIKYIKNRKFSLIVVNDAHEGTLETLKYLDNIIYNFLNSLFNENYLKETSIFLLSDHGVGMPSIYYFYNFYQYEMQLPMLYLIINDRNNKTYEEQYLHLSHNQQTFITAFDIYNTIINIIYGDKYLLLKEKDKFNHSQRSKDGESLFLKLDQKKRSSNIYFNMYKYACT